MEANVVLHKLATGTIAELQPASETSRLGEDPIALLSYTWENEASWLLIHDRALSPEFFNLKSGVAGEALQKLVTYNCKTAILMSDLAAEDIRIRELAHDHRRHPVVRFFEKHEEALAWLTG